MKIKGTQEVEIEITDRELSYAIMQKVLESIGVAGDFDDAGCDWFTYADFTYIGDKEWQVSDDRKVARLVDAANILQARGVLTL